MDLDNYADPATLDSILDDIGWYPPLIPEGTQVWAGENGPKGGGEDGTCGDNSACGTYATVPWYADSMALRASNGFVQFQRQDFVGGRYALVGSKHDDEFLGAEDDVTLKPDFWVNFLWKRTIGYNVLNTTVANDYNRTLRAYAFGNEAPSPWGVAKYGDFSLVIVNLANETREVALDLGGAGAGALAWTLTAGPDGAAGVDALLNGQALPAGIADGQRIEEMPVDGVAAVDGVLELAGVSVTFVVVSGN